MAKKELNIEEDIIDLTELIESGDKGDRRAAAAYAKAATVSNEEGDDEDFAAILAETSGAPHKVDANETLDMSGMGGIDNLLESLDIPPQPQEKGATKSAAAAPDDLDSVLDDLLGSDAPTPKAEPVEEPPKAAKSAAPANDPELDIAPEPTASESPSDLDGDLDDILASFDETPKAQTSQKQPSPEPDLAVENDLTADLDDILGAVEPPAPVEPIPEPEPAPALKKSPPPAPDLIQEAPKPVAPKEPEADLEFPDELDDMLDSAPLASEPESALDQTSLESELAGQAQENLSASKELSAQTPTEPALLPQAHAWSPETIVSLCRNLSSGQEGATQQALQDFARELGEQTAHLEDLSSQLAQIGKRLLACESRLSASRARIASVEKTLESTAALEDLLKDGTPLHSGFLKLISAAVSNSLNNFSLPDEAGLRAEINSLSSGIDQINSRLAGFESQFESLAKPQDGGLEEEIGQLISNQDNTEARLGKLEKRVAQLTENFGKEMEKAAAATVAKILHEEISRLAQG